MQLGNAITVGANAVISKSYLDNGVTLAGMPARKISNHTSRGCLADGLYDNEKNIGK